MNNRKILVVLIIGIFIISSTGGFLGAGENLSNSSDETIPKTEEHKYSLSKPIFTDTEGYIKVTIEEQTSYLMEDYKPMLPVITKVYKFPLGTTINEVNVQINQEVYTIDKKIQPAPEPVPFTLLEESSLEKTEDTSNEYQYDDIDIYPINSYEIKTGCGLDGEEHVLILNVRCYTQYKPAENKIYIPNEILISLDYNTPPEPLFNNDEYDMLIITHEKFEEDLQPLVDHKNNIGIKTIMTTVDEIYSQYIGVADWEEVKLYIADAIQNWGITYVMLAGGHKGQTNEWYVPDFRSNNYDNNGEGDMDITYSCDLYFADVFSPDQYGRPIFETWDGNSNGIYAEGPYYTPFDIPDFYPDVYVGRIPLRYSWETPIIVNKIINYELYNDPSWFKKAIVVGGDTSPRERYGDVAKLGIYEGELTCDISAGYLEQAGFEVTKCYTSTNGDIQLVDDLDLINTVVNGDGYGFMEMQMHANPALGGNHVMDLRDFVYFYTVFDIKYMTNGEKLPFIVMDGCHTSQFDVTFQKVIEGGLFYEGSYWLEYVPHDAASWMVLQGGGGAIANIGPSALGYGYLNEAFDQGLGGWISPRFVYQYAVKGNEYAGAIWGQTLTDYINNFDIVHDDVDRKTVEERVLLGDPSLKLGGIGSSLSETEDEDDEIPVTFSGIDVPVWEVGDTWTFDVDNIDYRFNETEGRDINLKFNTEDLKLTVTDVQSDTYITEFSTSDANIEADIYFDYYDDEHENPLDIAIQLKNIDIQGQIIFTKASLAIKEVELNINLDLIENLEGLPIDFNFPPLIEKILTKIKLPAEIQVTMEFDPAFTFLDFPLESGKSWGMPTTTLSLRIDGEISSIWLRLANFLNKILRFIPDEYAKYLPVIDIGDILEDFGIPSLIISDIPGMEAFFRKPLFRTPTMKTLSVPAGTFETYQVLFASGIGEIYYSPEAENFVKITTPLNDFCPIVQNINIALKSTNQ